ncbi:MAG: radical SAM protein [Deltaproteobacteria bacterium]|nr:radical SAM protein [Deltaproteobacteria bacterium]
MTKSRSAGGFRRLVQPLLRKLETAGHPLRYLFLEITRRCNLHCRHCGSDCGRETQCDELSTEEWLGFLDVLARRFDRRKLALVLTGGEPLCRPELDRILDRLREHGFAWGMVTNGWALSPRNLERLLRANIASVTVSLDGLRASHDWLRGVEGSWEHALAGIGLLARAGIPFFDVVTCANPRNLAELPEVGEVLRAAGVRDWRLFSIFPKGRARGDAELLLPPAGFRELLAFIRREREAHDRSGFHARFSCEAYLPGAIDREVRDEPYFCRAGINIASVLCDGAIGACPNITRSLVQGNVRRDDFHDVWEEKFGPYRERSWMRRGPCEACAEWKRCLGNSLHLWDDEAQRTAYCSWELACDRQPDRRP